MLDPRSILLAMPCGDGRMMTETAGMLIAAKNQYAAFLPVSECSVIQIARNVIADAFLSSPFEWLVCVDNDIVPTMEDFRLLLEPCDTDAVYCNVEDDPDTIDAPPRPSRVICSQLQPEPGKPLNFETKCAGAADMLVAAEYAYKNDTLEPVKLGFGFVRIHRIVFEKLQELKHPENPAYQELSKIASELRAGSATASAMESASPEFGPIATSLLDLAQRVEQNLPSPGGEPRLWQGAYRGKIITDYFPTGPMLSTFVPTAQWKGEDHGFFTLCHMAGIIPRIETRTRLTHIGRKGYPYMGPDVGGGQ